MNYFFSSAYPTVFVWRIPYDPTLTSYWPMNGSSANELIANRHFVCESSSQALFSADRNGNAAQAVRVSNASNSYKAPSAVYFAGDFSFSGWFKMNSYKVHARFIG
jgi:hypothetical protein